MSHVHTYTRSKPDATIETCHCGAFRHTEHSGPAIVGIDAVITVCQSCHCPHRESTCPNPACYANPHVSEAVKANWREQEIKARIAEEERVFLRKAWASSFK